MMTTADLLIERLNEWRAGLVDNIADEPPYTDDINGPVRNLPPLEGDDLNMIRTEIEQKISDGWPVACVEKWMRFSEEVCPFWAEDHALKQMKEAHDKAILQGARK